MPVSTRRRSRGMTLIEVLIAIVIFAIGLLGIAALQVAGLRYTKGSQTRAVAVLQAENMIDRMRANPTGVADDDYDSPIDAQTVDCDDATCTPAELAAFDWARWLSETRQALGVKRLDDDDNTDANVNAWICIDSTPDDGTTGAWACDGVGDMYALKVEWQERAVERGDVQDTYSTSGAASADAGYVLNRYVVRFLP